METSLGIIMLCSFISFVIKIIIHIILDNKNGSKIAISGFATFVYLLPYGDDVSEDDKRIKKICNKFYKIAIFFFVVSLIGLVIKNFASR
ncbi:MAG: hypothetical protein JSU05_00015 [Bacteroidetes bacterium]|nr:hypothetical protein [Bacteroidota bacterium]